MWRKHTYLPRPHSRGRWPGVDKSVDAAREVRAPQRTRLIGRLSTGGRDLDHNPMSIQIMQDQTVTLGRLLADKLHDAGTCLKPVVVVDDYTAWNQAIPNPVCHVFGGLINIHVDMAEPEFRGWVDQVRRIVGENAC